MIESAIVFIRHEDGSPCHEPFPSLVADAASRGLDFERLGIHAKDGTPGWRLVKKETA